MNSSILDLAFPYRKNRARRHYKVEEEVYEFLKKSETEYNATRSDILNACIDKLISSENYQIYRCGPLQSHSFLVDERILKGLEEMNRKTKLTRSVLVNMAVRNIMQEE